MNLQIKKTINGIYATFFTNVWFGHTRSAASLKQLSFNKIFFMKNKLSIFAGLLIAASIFSSCKKNNNTPPPSTPGASNQKPSGVFDNDATVFLKSAISIDTTDYAAKFVTLPLLQGWTKTGQKTYYIITESSDFADAKKLGVNYSPILKNAIGSGGEQNVTRGADGLITFPGTVDFTPVRSVVAGTGNAFPPSVANPGAIGDADYSPLIVLNGIVYNAPQLFNNTGTQDRVFSIDFKAMTINVKISDGFYNGKQLFYHLVTDASDPVPAAIEDGIYAPKLKNLPAFGKNTLADKSVLRGFALVANGPTGVNNPIRQGLESTILDGGLEPINVFQQGPDNGNQNSNYGPMWDAHIFRWTDGAIAAGLRVRVKTYDQIKTLLANGSVISDPTATGAPNPTIAGLRNNGLIINCAVVKQP
jgi:hypothetical protein